MYRLPSWFRLVLVAALLVAALPLSLAGGASARGQSDDFDAEFTEGDCRWELPDSVEEGDDIVCGTVAAPLRHDEPDGETVELAVGIVNPDLDDPAGDPVFMLNGGPGYDSSGTVALLEPSDYLSGAAIAEGRTLVVFDQRGTGYSTPGGFCPGDTEPDGTRPIPGTEDLAGDDLDGYAEVCLDYLEDQGVDLEDYTTTANAYDIDVIRRALGYEAITLYGESYGTRLALEAMRVLDERTITSVVLESVLAPDSDWLSTFTIGFSDALELAFDQCADDRACDRAYPDLEDSYADALERLAEEPYESSFEDYATGDDIPVSVDPSTFNQVLYQMVFSGAWAAAVPAVVASTAAGDYDVVDQVLFFLASGSSASGTYFAVSCQDWISFEDEDTFDERVADADILPGVEEYGSGLLPAQYIELCDAFDLDRSDDVLREPVESDIPTLVVSGAFDPITPASRGEHVAETLPNSFVVVDPNGGHVPSGSDLDCLQPGVVDFLDDPETEPDFSCLDDQEVGFLLPEE